MKSEIKYYDPEIYPIDLLKRAVQDYSGIGRIKLTRDGHLIKCEFTSAIVPVDVMANEFDNYLVELLNAGDMEW